MSPTVFRADGFRFFFFSREEPRMHIHVQASGGEAKYWIDPDIELAMSVGLKTKDLAKVEQLIRERERDIRDAWHQHFGS